jgi:hypothetical protein
MAPAPPKLPAIAKLPTEYHSDLDVGHLVELCSMYLEKVCGRAKYVSYLVTVAAIEYVVVEHRRACTTPSPKLFLQSSRTVGQRVALPHLVFTRYEC